MECSVGSFVVENRDWDNVTEEEKANLFLKSLIGSTVMTYIYSHFWKQMSKVKYVLCNNQNVMKATKKNNIICAYQVQFWGSA